VTRPCLGAPAEDSHFGWRLTAIESSTGATGVGAGVRSDSRVRTVSGPGQGYLKAETPGDRPTPSEQQVAVDGDTNRRRARPKMTTKGRVYVFVRKRFGRGRQQAILTEPTRAAVQLFLDRAVALQGQSPQS